MDDPYTKRGINISVPLVFSSKYIFAFMHYFEIVPQARLNSAICHASPVYTKAGTVDQREWHPGTDTRYPIGRIVIYKSVPHCA